MSGLFWKERQVVSVGKQTAGPVTVACRQTVFLKIWDDGPCPAWSQMNATAKAQGYNGSV